jgi:hypothetical protein
MSLDLQSLGAVRAFIENLEKERTSIDSLIKEKEKPYKGEL